MRTVRSAASRFGRGLGVVAVAMAVAGGASACSKAVTGSAAPVPGLSTSAPPPSSGSQPPSSGNLSQAAEEACGRLPKDAVTSSFGVAGVTVTAASGQTLPGGIQQIKCVIDAKGGFRVNVVVQVYPAAVLASPDQYVTILRQKFANVQTMTVPGADVAGTFQQNEQGSLVDEGFAAKKDSSSGSINVLIAAIADSPGIKPKLITFVAALAKT